MAGSIFDCRSEDGSELRVRYCCGDDCNEVSFEHVGDSGKRLSVVYLSLLDATELRDKLSEFIVQVTEENE